LNGSTRFLLNNDRASFYATATRDVAYPHLDDIAPSQLAIDSKIKQGAIPQMTFTIKEKPDCPNLLRFQSAL
jgi:hypothetical protein